MPIAIYNRDIMSSFVSTLGTDLCFAQRQQLLSLDYGVGPAQGKNLSLEKVIFEHSLKNISQV